MPPTIVSAPAAPADASSRRRDRIAPLRFAMWPPSWRRRIDDSLDKCPTRGRRIDDAISGRDADLGASLAEIRPPLLLALLQHKKLSRTRCRIRDQSGA